MKEKTSTVVVTPEMLEAGFQVLSSSGIADEYLEADKLLLAEIYRAMFLKSQQASLPTLEEKEAAKTCCTIGE